MDPGDLLIIDIFRLKPHCVDDYNTAKYVYYCGQEYSFDREIPSNIFFINHDWEREIGNGSVAGFMSIAGNYSRNDNLTSFVMHIFDDKYKIVKNITQEIKIQKIQRLYRNYIRIKKIKKMLPYLLQFEFPNEIIKTIIDLIVF